jgi:peptide deformylase
MKLDPKYLRTRSCKVEDIDETRKLYKEAAKLMWEQKGVGLAANQVGHNKRWFVWQHGMVINPEIISETGSTPSKEGCLSFPGRTTTVRRAKIVEVRYIDEQGKSKDKKLVGLPAIVFQRELDHLNGVCLF